MTQHAGPGIRRHLLAKSLVRHREAAGLKFEDVVRRLDFSKSKISRIENATSSVSIVDTRALARLYGVDDAEADRLELMARIAKQRGWWHVYGDSLVDWFTDFVVLESEAVAINIYEIDLIPGLLQTPEYARWIMRACAPDASDEVINDRAEVRQTRQRRVESGEVQVWAILDEATLARAVGSYEARVEQLRHLLKLAELPNVTLQVLPFVKGPHMAMGTAFHLLKFAEYPSVVYIDNLTGGLYLDGPYDIERYMLVLDHLRALALDPAESVAMVKQVMARVEAGY
ncbi:transcriptional regulator with XRE-family HTH domain [Kibdelosporangium banguiense]|uniref:Transcriptional regulator with XRE-family HTH domain n=1 Tax=Kibdelosporangium banguiense TaxID=1365924 RepID=A0ABS4TMI6_9PSEU|nr:helix-turn-helix transcriptional regulator [Kibdelosporangium banguiense]MBP2325617.1 transcriptional regulator with XRE-family HTH domain [Kibdelosporangium banguiense]